MALLWQLAPMVGSNKNISSTDINTCVTLELCALSRALKSNSSQAASVTSTNILEAGRGGASVTGTPC